MTKFIDTTITGILAKAWEILKQNYKTIIILLLIIYVPINLINAYFIDSGAMTYDYSLEATQSISTTTYLRMQAVQMVLGLLSLVAMLAIMYIVKAGFEDKKITLKESLLLGLKKWPQMFGTYIVMVILLVLLLLLFIIPGVIFSVYWMFALYVVVWHDKVSKDALNHSKAIVRGRWWQCFGYTIVFSLIYTPIIIICMIPAMLFPFSAIIYFISMTVMIVSMSYLIVVYNTFFVAFDNTKLEKYKTSYEK